MRFPILYLGLYLYAFSSPTALAGESCRWKNWAEIAASAAQNSPELQFLQSRQEHRHTLVESASLSPPALLSGQYRSGQVPWKSGELETTYLWSLESAEKQSSRVQAARAESAASQADIDEKRQLLSLELALIQQALRRIEGRRDVLEETRDTYTQIIGQYAQRLSLGPEQEASLAVFKIAKQENDLRIESLGVERSQLLHKLSALTGCASPQLPPVPPLSKPWPSIGDAPLADDSPSLKRLDVQDASLQHSLTAELKAMEPDLMIGPMLILGHDQDRDKNLVEAGIAASIPIGAERIRSLSVAKAAEFSSRRSEIDFKRGRLKGARAAWLDQYRTAVRAMRNGLSLDELSKSHRKLEALFRGERVSAALVIESHRQMLEHISTYTELEAKASEALWNLRYLDGNLEGKDL